MIQYSCATTIRWLRRVGREGAAADLAGTFSASRGSSISMQAFTLGHGWSELVAAVPSWSLSQSLSWSWCCPWPTGTDFPCGLRAAWSLRTYRAVRHPGHYLCLSPAFLVGCSRTVFLGELLVCWLPSPSAPSFLPNITIPWHLRSCADSAFKTEKLMLQSILFCDLVSKLNIRTDT